ncbi:MAG: hypothetical protein D6743_02090 [Calditrichaeota bacterium]|nr:MAG: hypothetical protein D6743_02090 [Calditrichota bacterium]
MFTIFLVSVSSRRHSDPVQPRQCGVSWVAGPEPVTRADFAPLVRHHVTWIVQTPFGWQSRYNSPELRLVTGGGIFWGETDEGLRTTTRLAKQFGIKTLLKPHIWMHSNRDGKWRGEIEMENEEDWQRWFANYRKFILHYARLAEENGIEALCIGTELHMTAIKREQDWRKLIADIRKSYSGKLTYAANWYREFQEIPFWDALDFIGIQGYFPLSDKRNPSVEELKRGWEPHLAAIERVSRAVDKPVVFTEIGYRSSADAAIRPWEWPGYRGTVADSQELKTQANCYEAFFQTFWQQPWCEGVYFWKWFPKLREGRGRAGRDFTPQGKPAEKVMAHWFGRSHEG